MKKAAIVLIIVSAALIAYFMFTGEEPPAPPPEASPVTLRVTTSGDVVGFIDKHGARAWMGIPFAQAPTDSLRWRAPREPDPWTGTLETIAPGNACAQLKNQLSSDPGEPDRVTIGSEDCLYLNVWAPTNARDLPVMFWIHGGGNSIGEGASYNGATLATAQDVVVITINYRLGILGWFAHPDMKRGNPLDDSGNYGTLDIVRALEWTRDNIAEFGGDPNNVTVFGESAGGFDTLAMMASPLAEGLFHRAIVQSGGFNTESLERAGNFANEGGHPFSAREITSKLLVADGTVPDEAAARSYQNDMGPARLREYLYSKTAEDIYGLFEDTGGFGMINAPDNFGDDHVLPSASTKEIFSSADNHNMVPVILGTNRDEPTLFMFQNPAYLDNFLGFLPRLKDEDVYLRNVKYQSLAWKERGVDSLANYMTEAGNPNVYTYRFDWDEEGSVLGFDLSTALGAAHGLEIAFVFGDFDRSLGAYLYENSPGRHQLADSMMSYWAEFAYNGDPGSGRDGSEAPWQAWGTNGTRSIIFDTLEDQGIRMTSDEVTLAAIKDQLARDPEIADTRERCQIYVSAFGWELDRVEYDSFGPEGCAQYDPMELRGF